MCGWLDDDAVSFFKVIDLCYRPLFVSAATAAAGLSGGRGDVENLRADKWSVCRTHQTLFVCVATDYWFMSDCMSMRRDNMLPRDRNFGCKMSGKCNDWLSVCILQLPCHYRSISPYSKFKSTLSSPSSQKSKMSQKSKSHTLTLAEKCQVIDMSKKGLSQRKLVERFNVGKTQIQLILKSKEEIILRAYFPGWQSSVSNTCNTHFL